MKKTIIEFLKYALTIFLVILINLPIIFIIVTSFKSMSDIMQPKLSLWFKPTLENYKMLFNESFNFTHYITNSILVATFTTLLSLGVSIPAAYGISRFGKFKSRLAFWILSIRMAPPIVFALPLFMMLRIVGLIDSVLGLMFVYLTSSVPLSVWILTTFMMDLPISIEESARLDGARRGTILLKIVIPLLKPGIVSVFILNFIMIWNEFFFAFLMTQDKAVTFTVGMARFITGYSIYWGSIAAAATLAIIPTIVVTFIIQKHLVRGLTFGAIK